MIDHLNSNGIKWRPNEKLILDLNNKKNYVIHYMNLKLYLSLGLKLVKIHKILRFRQSRWMKTYIEFNTKLREKAKDKFETDLFKLLNNAIYGKSCENVRNYLNVKLVLSQFQAKTYLKRPLFDDFQIIDKNKAIIKMRKAIVKLNRPIILGFTILETSKCLMYQFFYEVFKVMYGENVRLLYTDTDALILEITTKNLFDDFVKIENLLDLSNYDESDRLFSDRNKKRLGHLKDESEGRIITEFIGLKAKLYSLIPRIFE